MALFANMLQEAINKAPAYSKIELPAGKYIGSIVIDKPLIIDGINKKAIISGDNNGSVITIKSSQVTIKNLTIIDSGAKHEEVNAGISIIARNNEIIENVKIVNNDIKNCLFGIDMQMVNNSLIENNYITSKDFDLGLRGDGVRLWYSNDNILRKNHLYKSRDFVIWYSHGNLIEKNIGEYCRYSLHFMYAGKNDVKDNIYKYNSVGIFFMYSQDSIATNNTIENSLGTTGLGIGLKDCSNFTIKDNTVIYCARGFYIDRSPFQPDAHNYIENNRVIYNSIAFSFHSLSIANIIKNNIIKGNIENVYNDSYNTKFSQNIWDGNYWDDYEGFDRDGDGFGDNKYISYQYADKIWLLNPNIKFFYGSPIISILNFIAKLAPISEPLKLVEDNHPRIKESELL
jgi:nitrous oxidase accessory protein